MLRHFFGFRLRSVLAATALLSCGSLASAFFAREWKSGILWPEPPIVNPGPIGGAPADAIVLFDGKDLSQWNGGDQWLIEDGIATAHKTGLTSKQSFGDCQIHLEFASPAEVKGSSQGRGNSGVYIMGRYELQILDSYNNLTYFDGQCGAIYKQRPPMVNVCRGPGEWQTYDILFTAPRFNADGSLKSPAYITALQNGVVIHNHLEILGTTAYTEPPRYSKHSEKEPLSIQFHGNPVRFRNIWIRENVHEISGEQLGGSAVPPPVAETR